MRQMLVLIGVGLLFGLEIGALGPGMSLVAAWLVIGLVIYLLVFPAQETDLTGDRPFPLQPRK